MHVAGLSFNLRNRFNWILFRHASPRKLCLKERYRSGHTGADSKSVGGFAPRGFESHPLRQLVRGASILDSIGELPEYLS